MHFGASTEIEKARFRMPIYTNHAIDRMRERKFERALADQTFQHPDNTHSGKEPGTTEFNKHFGKETVTLIGKQNEKHEWVIISAWIDPPRPGTADEKEARQWRAYQKAGFWGKLWYRVRRKLGV
jgi:hypothetical protein